MLHCLAAPRPPVTSRHPRALLKGAYHRPALGIAAEYTKKKNIRLRRAREDYEEDPQEEMLELKRRFLLIHQRSVPMNNSTMALIVFFCFTVSNCWFSIV